MVKSAGMLIKGSLLALLVAVVYAESDAIASDPAPEANSDGDKSASYAPRKRYGNQKGGNGSRWRNGGRPRQKNRWGGRMKKRTGRRWRRPASNWKKASESESWDSPSIDWDGDAYDTDDASWSADGYKTCDTVSHSLHPRIT